MFRVVRLVEDKPSTIFLLSNADGTVGVIAVRNKSEAVPQILINSAAVHCCF